MRSSSTHGLFKSLLLSSKYLRLHSYFWPPVLLFCLSQRTRYGNFDFLNNVGPTIDDSFLLKYEWNLLHEMLLLEFYNVEKEII